MDWVKRKNALISFASKNRYAILVLLAGLVLILLPTGKKVQSNDADTESTHLHYTTTQEQLTQILSHLEGAGKVEVLLTYAYGEETVYQTNDNDAVSSDTSTTKYDTVIITDADRNESGLIRQINPPVYLGAIVVCQGADDPGIKLAVVEAVSKATGLGADKISVLKMK